MCENIAGYLIGALLVSLTLNAIWAIHKLFPREPFWG